ncbi:MAG: hypothetical protein AAF518_23425 [Spirochaetota bacterium]
MKKAATIINQIRFVFVGLYLMSALATFKTNTLIQNTAYLGGIGTVLIFALVFLVWNRRVEKIPDWLPRIMLVLDVFVLFIVVNAGILGDSKVAIHVLNSPIFFITYFFYMLCSAFLISTRFVIFMGWLSASFSALTTFIALQMGVRLSTNREIVKSCTQEKHIT